MPDFNQMQRQRLAAKNQAMPDGSFPIRNVADLKRAIQAYGRAKNKAAAKAWIIKRAKQLGEEDLLPEDWRTDTLAHYGIKGQKWGIRRYQNENGTLTNAGKKRYSTLGIKIDVRRAKKQAQKENVHGRKKGSTGSNYDKAIKEREKLYDYLDRRLDETYKKERNAKNEKEKFKAWDDYEKDMTKTLAKGERLVSEAMLKDAGYSDKDAKAGYEWLRDHSVYLNVPTFAYYGSKKKRR